MTIARSASRQAPATGRARVRPRTLAVDVGGTGIKASVLDASGRMLHRRLRVRTPDELTPARLVQIVGRLAARLPAFERASVGFPGVVVGGRIRTAPNLGTERFRGFDLATELSSALRRPVRVANDADVQGLGVVRGDGVEMVITLGTGFGSSLFLDGRLAPHLEFAHHPFHKGKTYEEMLGDEARDRLGHKRWQREVKRAIDTLCALVNYTHLYIGGGNARHVHFDLPDDVEIVDNKAGIWGGIRLWDDATLPNSVQGTRRAAPAHRTPSGE